jgi:hypothetical protein
MTGTAVFKQMHIQTPQLVFRPELFLSDHE